MRDINLRDQGSELGGEQPPGALNLAENNAAIGSTKAKTIGHGDANVCIDGFRGDFSRWNLRVGSLQIYRGGNKTLFHHQQRVN